MATLFINEWSLNTCSAGHYEATEQHDLVARIDENVTGTRPSHEQVQFLPIVNLFKRKWLNRHVC
jgi:hypothetical protein